MVCSAAQKRSYSIEKLGIIQRILRSTTRTKPFLDHSKNFGAGDN
jgi:hypothetical protein